MWVYRINHESPFAWQAHYLVRLQGDSSRSAHCKWPIMLFGSTAHHTKKFHKHKKYLVPIPSSRRHTTTKLRCCKGPSACTLRKLSSKHIRWRLQSRKHVSETEGGCFFSIGPSVLIGLCSLYRVETSAPGLSGHYWYIYCTILSSIFLANMTYSRSILGDFDASGWWRSSCDQVMDVSLKPSTWPFPETKINSSPLENKHIPKRTFHQRTTRFSGTKLLAVRFRERVV